MNTIFNHDNIIKLETKRVEARSHNLTEIKRASSFLVRQIRKGWTIEEAFGQVETQYGLLIKECVAYYMAGDL